MDALHHGSASCQFYGAGRGVRMFNSAKLAQYSAVNSYADQKEHLGPMLGEIPGFRVSGPYICLLLLGIELFCGRENGR